MRDDKWLFEKLDEIWDKYFADIPQENDVRIIWGRRARNRLGSIKQLSSIKGQASSIKHQGSSIRQQAVSSKQQASSIKGQGSSIRQQASSIKHQASMISRKVESCPVTVITINKLFQDKQIPEPVVISTIAHELTHYAHGFHSPLEQRYATPHAGGIIDKEMDERGLKETRLIAKKWLKENWREYLLKKYPPKQGKIRKRKLIVRWMYN
ncbi:hypothetical protein K0A96_00795 [Patescibacteria group bacterium]|nr:hypothetical protein [Patescibacteria group bacterium]